jgi:hypothetical protein
MRVEQFGALPMFIVFSGMFAGIRAIWKYKPNEKNEIDLKKDD